MLGHISTRVLGSCVALAAACAARGVPGNGSLERAHPLIVRADLDESRAYLVSSTELRRHALFALLDEHTNVYAGLVRVLGESNDRECDDCGNRRYYDAERVDGVIPPSARAVGPVSGPLRRARITYTRGSYDGLYELPLHQTATGWVAMVRVDLDGSGGSDLELVARCAHSVQASCRHRACDRICTGTRWASRAEPEPSSLDCVDLLPDVPDHCPDDPADPGLRDCSECPRP
jgi:hypothetical protein